MIRFIATLHLALLSVGASLLSQTTVLRRAREDRGSVTIEQVIWAVAVIGIVAIVTGAIITFVEGKAGDGNSGASGSVLWGTVGGSVGCRD